jgi:hypothetical protein
MEFHDEVDVDAVITKRSLSKVVRGGNMTMSLSDEESQEIVECREWAGVTSRKESESPPEDKGLLDERYPASKKSPSCCRANKTTHALLWLAFLLVLYVTVGTVLSLQLKQNKDDATQRQIERMDPDAREKGRTNSDLLGVDMSGSTAQRVQVGIYIDKITDHSIMDSAWTADFYLWFKWNASATTSADTNGTTSNTTDTTLNTFNSTETRRLKDSNRPGNDKPTSNGNGAVLILAASDTSSAESDEATSTELNPGETFQIIEGDLLSKDLVESKVSQPDNATGLQTHYTLYKVQAKLTHYFDISRFPRDDHLELVRIEDKARDSNQLLYVPDSENSAISSRVYIHGYTTQSMETIVKWHPYKSTRGDPFVKKVQINYSQFLAGIYVVRPDWGLYWMMFQGVFASVGVAFLGIIIQCDSRFDLGIGGFFACVAATYISSTLLPMAGTFSLTDYVHAISLCTVLLTLVHIYMGKHIFKDTEERWFDFVGLAVFVGGYVGCIVSMSQAAT